MAIRPSSVYLWLRDRLVSLINLSGDYTSVEQTNNFCTLNFWWLPKALEMRAPGVFNGIWRCQYIMWRHSQQGSAYSLSDYDVDERESWIIVQKRNQQETMVWGRREIIMVIYSQGAVHTKSSSHKRVVEEHKWISRKSEQLLPTFGLGTAVSLWRTGFCLWWP